VNCNSDRSENDTLLLHNKGKVTKKLKLKSLLQQGHTILQNNYTRNSSAQAAHSPSTPSVPEDDKHSRFYMPSYSNMMKHDLPMQN